VGAHFDALVDGACAVASRPRLAALGLSASQGAEVDPAALRPNLSRLPRKQQKLYNRATLLAMLAASLAMDEASLASGAGDPERFGVVLGVNALSWDLGAMVGYLAAVESKDAPGTLDMATANAFCMRNINPLDYSLKTLPNLAAGHLAIAHGAQGICRAMTEGPVGGGHAIGQAFRMITDGDLDVALCGGADALLEELLFANHVGVGIFAPDGAEQGGTHAGEGSGVLILEEAERARARGATVHGEVRGFAIAAGDGTLPPDDDPKSLGKRLGRVIEQVCGESGAAPDVVSLHGDGIPSHEMAERAAIEEIFGGAGAAPALLRMKAGHGDLGAASAPVEFLACSVALKRAILPRTVVNRSHDASRVLRRALVISLGLFGECVALMLERSEGGNAD
jgi:3-oxoacyl-[acyl-carrier-protein] synthase II